MWRVIWLKNLWKTNFCSISNRSLTGLNSKPTEEKNSQLLVLQPMNRISAIEGEKASNAKSKRERLLPSIFPSACGNASAVRRLLDSHPCSRPFFPILCRRSVYEKIFWWEKKWLLDTVSRGGWHGSEFLVYLLVSFELNPSQHIISFDLFIFFLSIVSWMKNLSEDSLFLHWVITYLYSLLYSFPFLRVTPE